MTSTPDAAAGFLRGGGEMRARIREHDWSATPLGPVDTWPHELRVALNVCLASPLPLQVWWGRELTLFYNDAAIPLLVAHPAILGRPAREAWPKLWNQIEPVIESVLTTGTPATLGDVAMPNDERRVAFSFGPIDGQSGRTEGIFAAPQIATGADHTHDGACLDADALRRLAESEERLRGIVSQSIAGIALVDLTGTFIYVNDRFCNLTGRSCDELVGRVRMQEITHPDDLGRNLRLFRAALDEGTPFEIEKRYIRPDGSHVWVSNSVSRIVTPDGRPKAMLAVTIDITERKSAEDALARSEERFRALVTASADVVYRMSPDWREMLHLDGRDFVADTHEPSFSWLDTYIYPDDQQLVVSAIEEAIRTKGVFQLEHRVRRGDGTVGWTFSRAIPLFGDDGEIAEWFGAASDVTARKLAEEAVRDREQRLRLVLDSMPQKIFTATPDGQVDYMNPNWMEFSGLAFEEIRAWGWTRLVHPDDVAENVARWQRAIGTGEPFEVEHRFRRRDGQYRWHLSRARAIRNAAGEVVMWIGANTDVHPIKEAEEALRQADRMKDEFLATLSHELRTPLTAIIGWAEMMLMGGLTAQQETVGMQTILSSARAQSQLIEDVLDVSRITTGKLRLDRRPADLATIVEAAVDAARPAAEARRIPLRADIARGLPRHLVDPGRIQQVVWNLLSNAIKFSPPGAPVEVALRAEHDHAVIEVADQGRGIRREFLPHVFERFRQADSSSSRAHAGLGLGLSLAKELTELHGGTIEAWSEEGRGSRFTVRLPMMTAHEGEGAATRPREDDERPLAGARVLYVDDREDARVLIATMLSRSGAAVTVAADVDEALAAITRERPDVVVTDIAMPDRDGYDLVRVIRANPRWRELPVVALTAHAGTDDERRAEAAGFTAFLRKPVEVSTLAAVVSRARRGSGS